MSKPYRYRPALFFLAVYIVTWLPWVLGIELAAQPGSEGAAVLLNLLGLLGPIAMAIVFVWTSGSAALKADFRNRLFNLRLIRPLYAVVAVLLPFGLTLLAVAISIGFGQPADQFALSGGSLLPLIVLTMILAPIMEEVGWHGYGVDSLRAGHDLLKATFLFGLLWSVWHAPLALLPGSYQHALAGMDSPIFLANFFISVIPAAFVANWIYYRCQRSIAAAVLTHSMLNAAAVLIDAGQVAKCIATVLYAIVAALIVAFDGSFRQGPATFVNPQMQGTRSARPE